MRHTLFLAVMLCAVFLAFEPAASAAEPASDASAIWNRYLSLTEQEALANLIAGHTDEPNESMENATPQAQLDAMRRGYDALTAFLAPPLADVKSEVFAGDGVQGVWFKPDSADSGKALLYLHGGGYVVGSPATAAAMAGFLAKESGILCFSLDYPLAPEFPFPAAPDNAVAAYRMLLDKGFKPEHIVLAGDSAGGGLALALLVDIRDQSLPMPAGAYLISPWTDLTQSFASHETKRLVESLLTHDALEKLSTMYAAGADRKSPRISPAFADLRGLPPILVHTGTSEMLLDDSLSVVRNAAMADVPVTFMAWPGYGHIFPMMHGKLEGARKALQNGAKFFSEVMGNTLLLPHDEKK